MNIRRKMVIIVIASILLTAIPASVLVYRYAQAKILDTEISKLLESSRHQADLITERFLESKPKLEGLARLLKMELAKPVQADEIAAFHHGMSLDADGVWRNRKPAFNGTSEAGIFLPATAQLSDADKVRHWRIKRIMDVFGSAAGSRLENIWYLSLQRGEVIFDAAQPNFAFDQKADNDYTKTPWVTGTSPELNPERQFSFTPPLFDPVPSVWMVSAIYPLYLDDQWLGSLGEDMPLGNVLYHLFNTQHLFEGTQDFLLDSKDAFILAGNWQNTLETEPANGHFDLDNQPQLKALLQTPLQSAPQLLTDALSIDGKLHVAIGMTLQPVNWRYFKLVPIDEILQPSRQLFLSLVGVICLVSIGSGLLIGLATHRNIVRRIRMLTDAMRRYETGDRLVALSLPAGDDEITAAAKEFDVMRQRIEHNLKDIQAAGVLLKASEERWKFALEGAGDGVWDWNLLNDEVLFSKRWKQMLGYDDHEFPDRLTAAEALLHPEDKSDVLNHRQNYLDGLSKSFIAEFRMRHKSGAWKWILSRGMVVRRDEQAKPIRMIGTHSDITDRKQAEQALVENRRFLADLIENSAALIYVKDRGGVYQLINHKYEQAIGLARRDVIGKTDSQLFAEAIDKSFCNSDQEVMESGLAIEREERLQGQHDDRYFLSVKFPLHGAQGDINGVCSVSTDITERKTAELTLQKAKDAAEALAMAKSAFLTNMSHEIRTPLNAIIGLSQLAQDHTLPAAVDDYLKKIQLSSENLLGTLNNVLDFSKLDAGELKIAQTPFVLTRLLQNLKHSYAAQARSKHLSFNIEADSNIPVQLSGDALRIQQILGNLLHNAIKFTEHGSVSLKLHLLEQQGNRVRILFRVTDTGIGISTEDQQQLFQAFSQIDASITRRFDGTGLGLAISRSLLHLMGSDFLVDSSLGQGTVFSFDLLLNTFGNEKPAEPDHDASLQQTGTLTEKLRAQGASLAGKRILVAEDNLINQQVVREFLKLSGLVVEIANNGLEALHMLEKQMYCAILMDVHMPEMGGVEATRRIRQQPQYATLPIIALSAGVTQEERANCQACGMNDFIAKPVNPEQLINTLCHWLNDAPCEALATLAAEPPALAREDDPENAPEAAILSTIPGFDFNLALVMVGGDQSLLLEMLGQFYYELPDTLSEIDDHIQHARFALAHRQVHGLKSSAGYMGAQALQTAAQNLEASLKRNQVDAIAYDEFRTVLLETRSQLATLEPHFPTSN